MRKTTIDSRDLIKRRDEQKEQILEDFNAKFNKELSLNDYYDIDSYIEETEIGFYRDFLRYWEYEIDDIEEIDNIEEAIGREFQHGVTLIHENYFEEYIEDHLIDCGYIPKDFPSWIEINWEATANNVKQDYIEVIYEGGTYLCIV